MWPKPGNQYYLIDQVRGRWDYPTQKAALRNLLATYKENHPSVVIEDKASGPMIIAELRNEIGTLIPDAFGSIDRTLHGRTERQVLATMLDNDNWHGQVYVQHYDWSAVAGELDEALRFTAALKETKPRKTRHTNENLNLRSRIHRQRDGSGVRVRRA